MRLEKIELLYGLLLELKIKQEGYCFLSDSIPRKFINSGIYYFFDKAIKRPNGDFRVIRIGKSDSSGRLRQHQGNIQNGGGNHQGSVFRKHIGKAMLVEQGLQNSFPYWGKSGYSIHNHAHEISTSSYIKTLPFLFIPIINAEEIKIIETTSIELLSNKNQEQKIDMPKENWLGYYSQNVSIRESHLWNVHYTGKLQPNNPVRYDALLKLLERKINNF